MKSLILFVIVVVAVAARVPAALAAESAASSGGGASAVPQGRSLGLGIEVGEQNGASAKYLFDRNQGIDAGLGESDGSVSFHAGYVRQAFDILPKPKYGSLDLHVGLGFRVRDDQFGIRPIAGVGYWLDKHPAEIFFDLGPIFELTPNAATDFTAVLGTRFYFALK